MLWLPTEVLCPVKPIHLLYSFHCARLTGLSCRSASQVFVYRCRQFKRLWEQSLQLETKENHFRNRDRAVRWLEQTWQERNAYQTSDANLDMSGPLEVVDIAGAQFPDFEVTVGERLAGLKQLILICSLDASEKCMPVTVNEG